jgi:hypothetical protein
MQAPTPGRDQPHDIGDAAMSGSDASVGSGCAWGGCLERHAGRSAHGKGSDTRPARKEGETIPAGIVLGGGGGGAGALSPPLL